MLDRPAEVRLMRGLLLTRRRIVLEPGARPRDRSHLRITGGVVRIGAHSLVECLSREGVTLGRGCVIAAGSVVNSSFPDFSVIGGVPARLLRQRGPLSGAQTAQEHSHAE